MQVLRSVSRSSRSGLTRPLALLRAEERATAGAAAKPAPAAAGAEAASAEAGTTAGAAAEADVPVRKPVWKDWLVYAGAGVGLLVGYHGTASLTAAEAASPAPVLPDARRPGAQTPRTGTPCAADCTTPSPATQPTQKHSASASPAASQTTTTAAAAAASSQTKIGGVSSARASVNKEPLKASPSDAFTPSSTAVEMLHIMEPAAANPHGNVHGGAVLRLIDEAGAIAAARHARGLNVVTRQLDSMVFHEAMYIGEMAVFHATLTYVSARSMEVRVEVFAENLKTGVRRHTNSALLTYVALNDAGRAQPVPRLKLESASEVREFAEGHRRYLARRAAAAAQASSNDLWSSLSPDQQAAATRSAAVDARQAGHVVVAAEEQ